MSENKRIYDHLIGMLRFSLGIDTQKVCIPPQDRDALMRLVRRQSLFPLLAESFAFDASESEVADIRKQQLLAAYRFEQYESILSAVSALFESEQIIFIPLKGSVTNRYYPEPWMRTRSDIDILVQREALDHAAALLMEKLGYQIESKNYHDITLRTKNGLYIELHFSLLEKEEKMDRVLATVWQHTSPKNENSYEYVMSDAFFMFHQLAHTAYHFANGGCGVRFLVDLWLLEQNLDPDKTVLDMLCVDSGLDRFLKQLRRLMQYWFADGTADDLLLQMEAYLIDGTVFGTKKNRVAAEQVRRGGRIGFLFSRMFWPYDDLKEMYPSLKNKKYLLPFYQVRRWLRLLDAKKMKMAAEQININRSVDRDEAKELLKFIFRVGL